MCAQCAATGAFAATTAATGLRVYLGARLTGRAKRWLSGVVVVGGVLAAGVLA